MLSLVEGVEVVEGFWFKVEGVELVEGVEEVEVSLRFLV